MRKVLVLAVDYDDDISKAGVRTPIVGYQQLAEAALKFGAVFPDDSDLNVLFHALHVYNQLKSEGYEVEVALISGSDESHVEAGRKLRDQVEYLVETTGCSEVVLVLDSVEDELVVPIVQNQVSIVAVERVVVEQLRGVEETYVLFGRYLRRAIEDPKFSKIFFGLPGLLFLVYVLINATPFARHAWEVVLGVLGIFMVLRGFHIPEMVLRKWYTSSIYRVTLVLSLVSMIVGTAFTGSALVAREFSADPRSISTYVKTFVPFMTLSVVVLHVGRLTVRVLRKSMRVWRDAVGILFTIMMAIYINNMADLLAVYPELDVLTVIYDLGVLNWLVTISLTLVTVYVTLSYVERYLSSSSKRT